MTQVAQRNNHVLQVLKRLKETLDSDKKKYADKVNVLVMTWERIAASAREQRPLAAICIVEKMYKDTLSIMLQGEWPKMSPVSKTHLIQMLNRCRTDLCKEMPWLHSRFKKLLELVNDPWTLPSLERILHRDPCPATPEQIVEFCESERGLLIITRLTMLCSSRCEKVAIKLAEACYGALSSNNNSLKNLFSTNEYNYIFDIYLCLLYKYKKLEFIINVLKTVSVVGGYYLVNRLRKRSDLHEQKIWKFSQQVATVAARYFITVSMLTRPMPNPTLLKNLINDWLSMLNPVENNVESEVRKVMQPAESSEHIYLMAEVLTVLSQQLGNDIYRSLIIELYIRAVTADINHLERVKLQNDKEQLTAYEKHLASKFLALADLVKGHSGVRREFVLTAFSIHPSAEIYRRVEEEAVASGKASPHSTPTSQESMEVGVLSEGLSSMSSEEPDGKETATDYSVNNDSQDSGAFVEISNRCPLHLPYDGIGPEGELCFQCGDFTGIQTPHSPTNQQQKKKERTLDALILIKGNTVTESLNYDALSAPSQVLEADKLGLSPQVCADLVTLLGSNRYHLLTWVLEWGELSSRCIRYMDEADTIKSGKKELKFLEIDYNQYKDWPENDEEADCIEKGYEQWLEDTETDFDTDSKRSNTDDSEEMMIKTAIRRSQKQMGRYAESSSDSEDSRSRTRHRKRGRPRKRLKYYSDSGSISDSLGSDGQRQKRSGNKHRTKSKDLRKKLCRLKVLEMTGGEANNFSPSNDSMSSEPFSLPSSTVGRSSDPSVLKSLRAFRPNAHKIKHEEFVPTVSETCYNVKTVGDKMPANVNSNVFDCNDNKFMGKGERFSFANKDMEIHFKTTGVKTKQYNDAMNSVKDDLVSASNIPNVTNNATINVVHVQDSQKSEESSSGIQMLTPHETHSASASYSMASRSTNLLNALQKPKSESQGSQIRKSSSQSLSQNSEMNSITADGVSKRAIGAPITAVKSSVSSSYNQFPVAENTEESANKIIRQQECTGTVNKSSVNKSIIVTSQSQNGGTRNVSNSVSFATSNDVLNSGLNSSPEVYRTPQTARAISTFVPTSEAPKVVKEKPNVILGNVSSTVNNTMSQNLKATAQSNRIVSGLNNGATEAQKFEKPNPNTIKVNVVPSKPSIKHARPVVGPLKPTESIKAGMESMKPIESVKVFAEPVTPIEPLKVFAEPVKLTEPIKVIAEPLKPTELVKVFEEPVKPIEPIKVIAEPLKPTEPVKLFTEPVKSIEPAKVFAEPVKSIEPAKVFAEPVKPTELVNVLAEPVKLIEPVKVFEGPVKLTEPVKVIAEPLKPTELVNVFTEPVKLIEPVKVFEEPVKFTEPVKVITEAAKPTKPVKVVVEPVKPTEPIKVVVEPVEPKEPIKVVVEPVEPIEPPKVIVEPVEPIEPIKVVVEPVEPIEPVKVVVEPVEPIEPPKVIVEPVEPIEPIKVVVEPVEPIEPPKVIVEPVEPIEPPKVIVEPVEPIEPPKVIVEPVQPIEPIKVVVEPVKRNLDFMKSFRRPVRSIERRKNFTESVKRNMEPVKPTERIKTTMEPVKAITEPVEHNAEFVKPHVEPVKTTSEPVRPSIERSKAIPEPIKPTEPVKATKEPLYQVKESEEHVVEMMDSNISPAESIVQNISNSTFFLDSTIAERGSSSSSTAITSKPTDTQDSLNEISGVVSPKLYFDSEDVSKANDVKSSGESGVNLYSKTYPSIKSSTSRNSVNTNIVNRRVSSQTVKTKNSKAPRAVVPQSSVSVAAKNPTLCELLNAKSKFDLNMSPSDKSKIDFDKNYVTEIVESKILSVSSPQEDIGSHSELSNNISCSSPLSLDVRNDSSVVTTIDDPFGGGCINGAYDFIATDLPQEEVIVTDLVASDSSLLTPPLDIPASIPEAMPETSESNVVNEAGNNDDVVILESTPESKPNTTASVKNILASVLKKYPPVKTTSSAPVAPSQYSNVRIPTEGNMTDVVQNVMVSQKSNSSTIHYTVVSPLQQIMQQQDVVNSGDVIPQTVMPQQGGQVTPNLFTINAKDVEKCNRSLQDLNAVNQQNFVLESKKGKPGSSLPTVQTESNFIKKQVLNNQKITILVKSNDGGDVEKPEVEEKGKLRDDKKNCITLRAIKRTQPDGIQGETPSKKKVLEAPDGSQNGETESTTEVVAPQITESSNAEGDVNSSEPLCQYLVLEAINDPSGALPKFNQAFGKPYQVKLPQAIKPIDINEGVVENDGSFGLAEQRKTNAKVTNDGGITSLAVQQNQVLVAETPRVENTFGIVQKPVKSVYIDKEVKSNVQQTKSNDGTLGSTNISTIQMTEVQQPGIANTFQTVPKVGKSSVVQHLLRKVPTTGPTTLQAVNAVNSLPKQVKTQDVVPGSTLIYTTESRPQSQILIQRTLGRVTAPTVRQVAPLIYTPNAGEQSIPQTQTLLLATVPAGTRGVVPGTQLVRLPPSSGVWKMAPTVNPPRIVQIRPQNLLLQGGQDQGLMLHNVASGQPVVLHQVTSLPVKPIGVVANDVKTEHPKVDLKNNIYNKSVVSVEDPKLCSVALEVDQVISKNGGSTPAAGVSEPETVSLMKDIKEFENVFEETKLKFEMEEQQGVCLPEVEGITPAKAPLATVNVQTAPLNQTLHQAVVVQPQLMLHKPQMIITSAVPNPQAIFTQKFDKHVNVEKGPEKTLILTTTKPKTGLNDNSQPRVALAYLSRPATVGGVGGAPTLTVQKPLVVVTNYAHPPVSSASSICLTTTVNSQTSSTPTTSVSLIPTVPSPYKPPVTIQPPIKINTKAKTRNTKTSLTTHTTRSPPVSRIQQRPMEDPNTAQKIYAILEEYAVQLRNSPDMNNRPAPRRRATPMPGTAGGKRRRSKSKETLSDGEESSNFVEESTENLPMSEDSSSNVTVLQVCVASTQSS